MDLLLSKAKEASYQVAKLSTNEKNACLSAIRKNIVFHIDEILHENQKDILNAKKEGLKESMIERLTLTKERIEALALSAEEIENLDDPIGEVMEEIHRNGLLIQKVRVPFGVIGVIFEARPNVCVDIALLSLKCGNACVLKGGHEANYTNRILVSIMREAIKEYCPVEAITLLEGDRSITGEFITKKEYIDLLIPRGSKGLIEYITNHAKVPFIETGSGNCHLYVHEDANIHKAISVMVNAKCSRVSVCNAIETILVDEKIKDTFLPQMVEAFLPYHVEIRGDDSTVECIHCKKAIDSDYDTEYNDYIVAVKVVKNIKEAIIHINLHSSHHSEAILTENIEARDLFLDSIDSACVYHNASTRFTDGGCFGFGAEIGISTSKLHARGPMGLREITTYKYKVYGNGEIRE